MRDAPVGFQCPECLKEGAKQTRSGRTPYGGQRSANPALTSMVLIGINAAVWLVIVATGWKSSPWADRLSLNPEGICSVSDGSGYYPSVGTEQICRTVGDTTWVNGVADGAWWQLMTSVFTHIEPWHIAFNMLALWFLGPQLELAIGRVRFLALYLLSGLAGSAFVLALSNAASQTAGASGAIFGLMGGLLVLAFKIRGNVQQILMWIGINVVITVVGRGFISWQGHLGGFVGGVLIAAVIVYAPRQRRVLWQVGGLVVLSLVLFAAIAARIAQLA